MPPQVRPYYPLPTPYHCYQLAMLGEKLQHAEEGRARHTEATCVATARAAPAAAAMAQTRGETLACAALAEAEAEGQRLKAEAVRLGEVKRVLAREAAVTQQEASEAYLRCYTRCQASVSAAKAAQAASRRAEAEAEKSLVELKHQLLASNKALQRQVQVTEAVRAATALTARVAARCMRERTLAQAWGAWRHASWQVEGARLRRALRVAASFAAWRASWAKANEAGREKQREAEREAYERASEQALLAAAIDEREDLRRQLAALKAGVAAEREAAAVEKRECSARLTHACRQLLSACRPKEEPVRKEAPERTLTWLTVNTRSSKRQELRVTACWGGAEAQDPTPPWLRSAAVILQSAHAEAPQEEPAEPKEDEAEVAAFEGRQVAPHPSRPQLVHAVSSAVVVKLPHKPPLVQQLAAKAAAAAQAREQTGWQSPRALRAAGLAPGGLPVTPRLAAPYCATRRATEEPKATTTRFIVVEGAGASGLSSWRTTRRLNFFSEGFDG